MKILLSGIIEGNLPRLENQRIPVSKPVLGLNKKGLLSMRRKVRFIKSADAQQYIKIAIPQMAAIRTEMITDFIAVWLRIFYRTDVKKGNSADLNGELFYNVLEKAKAIENDRQIVEKHLVRYYDKKRPRVEFMITEPTEKDWG